MMKRRVGRAVLRNPGKMTNDPHMTLVTMIITRGLYFPRHFTKYLNMVMSLGKSSTW